MAKTKPRNKPKGKLETAKPAVLPIHIDLSEPSTAVSIKKTKEQWSEYHLNDGTIIRIKPVMVELRLVDDKFDLQGNPFYIQKVALITDITPPPNSVKSSK